MFGEVVAKLNPLTFEGLTTVLPPVASWQKSMVLWTPPVAPFARVKEVTFPVNKIELYARVAEKVGVGEKDMISVPVEGHGDPLSPKLLVSH